MAEEKQPNRPWKRQVPPLAPDWMSAQVDRLERGREEHLDSARKRQRETPREGDEAMQPGASSAAPASSASGQATELPSPVSLPPPVSVSEDMEAFRYVSLTPASFLPTRHLFMCAGRPIVVPCFIYSPTPPTFLLPSLSDAPKEAPQHNPMLWDCIGALSMQLLFGPMHHSEPLSISLNPFLFRAYCACIHLHPWSVRALLSGAGHEPRARERGRNGQLLWQQVPSSETGLCPGAKLQERADVQAAGDALR